MDDIQNIISRIQSGKIYDTTGSGDYCRVMDVFQSETSGRYIIIAQFLWNIGRYANAFNGDMLLIEKGWTRGIETWKAVDPVNPESAQLQKAIQAKQQSILQEVGKFAEAVS